MDRLKLGSRPLADSKDRYGSTETRSRRPENPFIPCTRFGSRGTLA